MNNEHQHIITYIVIATRLGFRYTVLPLFHLVYHRVNEKIIHHSVHKIDALKSINKNFKWLPDCIMLVMLVILDMFTECGHHKEE